MNVNDQGIIVAVSAFLIGLFLGAVYSFKIFDNVYFKLLLFLYIVWTMSIDILLSAIIGIIILTVYQLILKFSMKEGFRTLNNQGGEYLTRPLLRADELEQLGNNIDFTLITPEMRNKKLVEDGKKLLEEANNMENDLKTRDDCRERQIMIETRNMANEMIKTGLNGLMVVNNGEYYGDYLSESLDYPNINYNDN